jgi:tetratricopeptide (TPR) repeat protein
MDMTDAQNNLPKDQHQKWILLAIEDLGRAIKADPRLKEARTNLAIAYSADHRTGEAIAQLDSAIELAPDYINAYSLRARTLSKCTPDRCAEHPRLGDWPFVLTWRGQNWQL